MKFTPEIIAALQTLKDATENDFERHRIAVLERDLTNPPTVEQIDDKHQKFDGLTYNKDKSGHFYHPHGIHRDVWIYYNGEIPAGNYEIHHKDFNPANNNPENLQLLSKIEHTLVHNPTLIEIICPVCHKKFKPRKASQKYCSCSCATRVRNTKKAKPRIEKICPICGKKFNPFMNRDKQVCCSPTCGAKLRWQKRKVSKVK